MLENLVAWVLNTYVGEYLEDLNTDQLSIALLQGQVELENVPLKKSALRKFDVPLQVKRGLLGKLTLSVPLTRMRSEPWVVKMSDLLVLLEPARAERRDVQAVEVYEQSKKEQQLDELEKHHKRQLLLHAGLPTNEDSSQQSWWGASLVSAVVNNIQLILTNVHIRYEDNTTLPNGAPFSCGVRIHCVSAQTTNALGKAFYMQPKDGVNVFKKFELGGLSVYWNSNQKSAENIDSLKDLQDFLAPEVSRDYTYILQPFSAQLFMEKNSSKFPLKSHPAVPRFKFDFRPEKVNIEMSKRQLAEIRLLGREWARYERAREHRKWRPSVPIIGNAKLWWRFACTRTYEETRQENSRRTWRFALARVKQLNAYCRAYRRRLLAYVEANAANAVSRNGEGSLHAATSQSSHQLSSRSIADTAEGSPSVENSVAGVPSASLAAAHASLSSPNVAAIAHQSSASEDIALMKQIERDSEYSYFELQMFREAIFRQIVSGGDVQKAFVDGGSASESSFETVAYPDVSAARNTSSEPKSNEAVDQSPQNSGGLYSWISSWFSGSTQEESSKDDKVEQNEGNSLDMWNGEMKESNLSPYLKQLEKQLEDEILDVLNESWDDSTVLRRDTLLAEVALQLEQITMRFIDDNLERYRDGSARVLAMDLWHVAGRLHLSPRQHSTAVTLSVGDMSVQRLYTTPSEELRDVTPAANEAAEESLMFGFGGGEKVDATTHVLFAVGRAKSFREDPEMSSANASLLQKPLLQIMYRRRAPKLIARHTVDAKFSEISIMYDEGAFDDIANLFDTDDSVIDQKNASSATTSQLEQTSHLFMTVRVPEVRVELRSKRSGMLSERRSSESGSPFANATFKRLTIGVVNTEQYVTKVKLEVGCADVRDFFENSGDFLLRTIDQHGQLSELKSTSCPNLSADISDLEPSHITRTTSSPSYASMAHASQSYTGGAESLPSRKMSEVFANGLQPGLHRKVDRRHGIYAVREDESVIDFTFVDQRHPLFDTIYKKVHCSVEGRFPGVSIRMNRRSWTMLFDFFGLLGRSSDVKNNSVVRGRMNDMDSASAVLSDGTHLRFTPDVLGVKVNVNAACLRVNMNYPANKTQLGVILAHDFNLLMQMMLGVDDDPMTLTVSFSSASMSDLTPFYSEMYGERLCVQPREVFCSGDLGKQSNEAQSPAKTDGLSQRVTIDVLRYFPDDPQLKRDFDMRVSLRVPQGMEFAYVHTHRYLCALMDFWMQFFELQDQLIKNNKPDNEIIVEGHRRRVEMLVDVECPSWLILPLNQFCGQVIVGETSNIRIRNRFSFADSVPDFEEHCIENQYGNDEDQFVCLLDCLSVCCSQLGLYESSRNVSATAPLSDQVRVCEGLFEGYDFLRSKVNVLSRFYDLNVKVFRNLDGAFSHKVPDMAVVAELCDVGICYTTDFYRLLRGFLEKNIGESLVPLPEAIPIEILQKPVDSCEVGSSNKYATFAFRMVFNNVEFDCLVPSPGYSASQPFVPFARMHLDRARISFDCFIDNQSELDLICESAELYDTRYEHLAEHKRPSVFSTVLCPRSRKDALSAQLMSEAHLMLRKDEAPVVTLVLQNSRVLLMLDWLNDAKDFVLLNTEFVPKDESQMRFGALSAALKSGVLHRIGQPLEMLEMSEQTITLKVTLRESDLILVETPSSADSLALLAHTTAVLNMSDPHGVMSANLEIQRMNLDWCVMSSEHETRCQLTNEFLATITLSAEPEMQLAQQARALLPGLPSLIVARHRLNMEVNEMVARVSYRDILVIKSVVESSLVRFASALENSCLPRNTTVGPKATEINVVRWMVKSEQFSLWFLDEVQGTAFPLVRVLLNNLSLEKHLDKVNSSFLLAVDYFNQRVFGWEPLVEPWSVQQLYVVPKDKHLAVELHAEEKSRLNINVTQSLMQQALHFCSRWPHIKQSLDSDFRSTCIRSRSDHLPYLIRNETGSELRFTTAVDEVLESRAKPRKCTAKWISVAAGADCTFEFQTKRLVMMDCLDEPRQLVIRVEGWDEISPVNVDSVGTYFRLARYSVLKGSISPDAEKTAAAAANARLVIAVEMDKDGRKVVTIRSALTVINQLSDPILLIVDNQNRSLIDGNAILRVFPRQTLAVPLRFANACISVKPDGKNVIRALKIEWNQAKNAGEIVNSTLRFDTTLRELYYWMCVSVKREHYPEYEMLPGHTISIMPPLTLLNLLPIDAEFTLAGVTYAVSAGKQLHITVVDIDRDFEFIVTTDRFESVRSTVITRSILNQKPTSSDAYLLDIRMQDTFGRMLDMYASLSVGRGGAVLLSLWVPFWVVNKSGIPLILKQEATEGVAAGQLEEHERAKDRHPIMFSFADNNCPKQCTIRAGDKFASDPGYKPHFSRKFALSPGVQSLKLRLTHEYLPTLIYNIGVEVRQGTGRYKDTQVVLLTPRYLLKNHTSYELFLSHVDNIDQPNQHLKMASMCSLVWHENFEDKRMLCVKRSDVKYWSCPFRIDVISSFHVTMRDADETPQFVRVEIILNSAVFCVTFTNASYFPPPIQIENTSDVPVLYQQRTDRPERNHLRTICKARSTVDYAWDDHYAPNFLTLQVFENKSNSYDPQKPGMGLPLVYDNDVYIKFVSSFTKPVEKGFTDEHELVLEMMPKGKVMLNKQNVSDSSRVQLWRFAPDGCIENIGMNNRASAGERYVLDVLDKGGFMLMMLKRNTAREQFQKWHFTADKRLRCGVDGMYVEARRSEVLLAAPNASSIRNADGIPLEQAWELLSQRPGSGILDVECLHKGPTLVVRITDRAQGESRRSMSRERSVGVDSRGRGSRSRTPLMDARDFEMNISMRSGIGLSLINGQHEELIYASFYGIALHSNRYGETWQLTSSVEVIQVDNQLLSTDRWQLLYCQENALTGEPNPTDHYVIRPALKLEMNCTPKEHYDAFDCFRVKLCDMSVQLDELLLWKLIHFVQESEAADSVQPSALLQPPNTQLDSPDPTKARRCYFGTLNLEMGAVALSAVTIAKSGLPPELRKLRQQFNIKLVSFENAMVTVPPFRQFRYFETFAFLIETLQKFYLGELKNQTLNIIVTMDAFGNPSGLASDLKESIEGLVFEGDLGGFVSGLGYGVTNSISKVASSMAHGVGALTFDEQHELMRRRMLRCQPQADSNSALAHLYSGVKGLGVGVFGGLTAIVSNTYTESKRDGITGVFRGITTGAVGTVAKPVQGIFDLVEGTASAMKEIVGGPPTRKSHFPESRVRLPRVCSNLQSLLPCYSEELASAQMDLLRINEFSTNEVLLDVEVLLDQRAGEERIRQLALICSEQCYVLTQVDNEPSNVVQRIPYKHLKQMQPVAVSEHNATFASVDVLLELPNRRRQRLPHLWWCSRVDVAKRLCDKVTRAKQLYDHGKRTLAVAEDYDVF